jgi:hypothetical protein
MLCHNLHRTLSLPKPIDIQVTQDFCIVPTNPTVCFVTQWSPRKKAILSVFRQLK